jgi:hypothetical protein
MTEFYGKNLVFLWSTAAGTTDMTEYFRNVTFSPGGKIDDVTTGAATYKTKTTGVTDFTVTYKGLHQSKGTAVEDVLVLGQAGTIYLSPEGTATNARLYTLPVISQGPQVASQYDGLTELNVSFIGNGDIVYGKN